MQNQFRVMTIIFLLPVNFNKFSYTHCENSCANLFYFMFFILQNFLRSFFIEQFHYL